MLTEIKIRFNIIKEPTCDKPNIVILHNKENDINDEYNKLDRINNIIQCITIEDFKVKSGDDPSFLTILKELRIKMDIKEKVITLFDWENRNMKGNYTFISPIIINNKKSKICKLTIEKNGIIKTEIIYDLNNYDKLNYEDDYLIEDDCGNINYIIDTKLIVIPSEKVRENGSGKDFLNNVFDGCFDVNYYENNGESLYNCGERTETSPQLNHYTIANASHIYKIIIDKGTKNIIEDLYETMTVSFVKFGSTTIMPFPIKYLKEFKAMNK